MTQPSDSSTKGGGQACADRLRALLVDGDLTSGLPRDCRRPDLEAVLGARGYDGHGVLSKRTLPWTLYDFRGMRSSLRAWWEPHPGDRLIELDVASPKSALALPALLARLGAPEVELPARDLSHRAQLVYARVGLTFGVGELGTAPKVPETLRRVWIYVPTTTEDYRQSLGGDGRPAPANPLPR